MMHPITDDTIRAIWRAHGLGEVWRIVPATSGVSNRCLIVNDALVIRFNTFDTTIPKFENERIAYDLLAGREDRGLPVPSVVALDTSRRIVPCDYIILTRLPGTNLAESWRTLPPERVQNLAREAGIALARLHATTFPAFGKLHEQRSPRFSTWSAYFADYAQRYMDAAQRSGLLDGRLRARLEGVWGGSYGLLARVTRGVLVHSDYHYENILQDGGRLSGILDFEWALAGDPSYDFMAAEERERQVPGSEAAFMEGYQSVRSLDAEHDRRVTVYRLFLGLETAVMHTRQRNAVDAQSVLAQMLILLETLEAS